MSKPSSLKSPKLLKAVNSTLSFDELNFSHSNANTRHPDLLAPPTESDAITAMIGISEHVDRVIFRPVSSCQILTPLSSPITSTENSRRQSPTLPETSSSRLDLRLSPITLEIWDAKVGSASGFLGYSNDDFYGNHLTLYQLIHPVDMHIVRQLHYLARTFKVYGTEIPVLPRCVLHVVDREKIAHLYFLDLKFARHAPYIEASLAPFQHPDISASANMPMWTV